MIMDPSWDKVLDENDRLRSRVKELEKELSDLNTDLKIEAQAWDVTLGALTKDIHDLQDQLRWRPGTGKPEKEGRYLVSNRYGYMEMAEFTTHWHCDFEPEHFISIPPPPLPDKGE